MTSEKKMHNELDKKNAAVCGLYCEVCTLYIATKEDPERLKHLAGQFQLPEETIRCLGCRSEKRGPYCQKCKMFSCAAKRGIEFCSECAEYPCADLKSFQSARPHRSDLWVDLERIKKTGFAQWLKEVRTRYTCFHCKTINSAYDLKCRKCGNEPSCEYVERNRQIIENFINRR